VLCPSCEAPDITPLDAYIERELDDLRAMRESSAIRG